VRKRTSTFRLAVAVSFGAALALGACASGVPDEVLQERVEAALASASDVPADALTVVVSDGVVTITGSVVCQECGGRRTPPGFGTVQQSLGAVVRAIPGVERVEFDLEYEPPQDEVR
jgi:osmotically-inducible protein OsmY